MIFDVIVPPLDVQSGAGAAVYVAIFVPTGNASACSRRNDLHWAGGVGVGGYN